MSDLKQQALAVALLGALGERVTKAAEKARADLRDDMQEAGAERVAAKLSDGTKVASVTLAGAAGGRAYVADEAAFTAHVADKHPSEMEYTVRPSFRKRLLDEVTTAGGGELPPGVELSVPKPYVMNNFTDDGKDAVAEAWQAGSLNELLSPLLAIESGKS